MAKRDYRVDYHLICVAYFSKDMPSGSDLAELWSSLSVLGNRRVKASYVLRGDTKISKLKALTLGSPVLGDFLISRGSEISIGASSVRRDAGNAILDSDLNFIFSTKGTWDGGPTPGHIELSISAQVLEQAGLRAVLQTVRSFFEITDRSSPIFGLADVARPDDAFAGTVYGTTWPLTAPLARWIEQIAWMTSGAKKGDCVRGIYWGNYLSSNILQRLGGQREFASLFAKNACSYNGAANAHSWQFSNGMFFSLCQDPLDCRPNMSAGMTVAAWMNLKWLVSELGTKGVLNSW
jgi:hypothetical protein